VNHPSELYFFKPNRVWRCYLGGALLDQLTGNLGNGDALFPENWLGSVTPANNGVHQTGPDEGLSQLLDGRKFCDVLKEDAAELLNSDSPELGILCKFLDSAIRLPLQCHPDREFARKYCHSQYGKTESWFILGTREINGEKPYILLGFKPGIDRKAFREAVLTQDIERLVAMFHKIEVAPGDAFFIPGRLPHAIGSGVLMLEVQEPSDLVVQPERRIGEIELSDFDMWQNLTVDEGLDCFDYTPYPEAELRQKFQLQPRCGADGVETLVDATLTDCFGVGRLRLAPGESRVYAKPGCWQLVIATAGAGVVRTSHNVYRVRAGDSFFAPYGVNELTVTANADGLELYFAAKP